MHRAPGTYRLLTTPKGRIPETTLRCIRHLRQVMPGSTISVEVEKPNREGLVELAAEADVVFYSRSWAEVSLAFTATLTYVAHMNELLVCPLNHQPGPRIHQPGGLLKGRGTVVKGVGIFLFGRGVLQLLTRPGKRSFLRLCTWGEQGAALWLPSGEYIHQPANPSGDGISVVE